jgi:predicted transcriptional regulator
MNKKGTSLFRVLRLKSTTIILKSLLEGKKQYTDFLEFTTKHHLTKQQTQREWYTLTDKGRLITQTVIELEELLTC